MVTIEQAVSGLPRSRQHVAARVVRRLASNGLYGIRTDRQGDGNILVHIDDVMPLVNTYLPSRQKVPLSDTVTHDGETYVSQMRLFRKNISPKKRSAAQQLVRVYAKAGKIRVFKRGHHVYIHHADAAGVVEMYRKPKAKAAAVDQGRISTLEGEIGEIKEAIARLTDVIIGKRP